MLTISGNDIILTQGDTLTLTVTLKRGTETYTPEQDDVIRIACSKGWFGDQGYELMFNLTIPNDTLTVTIPAATTETLCPDVYNYDVQITHGDGCVDTVLIGRLRITREVE